MIARNRIFIVVIFLLPLVWGCPVKHGPLCIKDGVKYGDTDGIFRGQWYDYYERALSYMEGECYDAALFDLNRALKQNDRDRRMAATFGMHYIDYFPHREKGLIHFMMGDLEKAKREFETSIEQEQSEKAYYYLNRIRKYLLERKVTVAVKPHLNVQFPDSVIRDGDHLYSRNTSITITGIAEDPNYIETIEVAGEPCLLESSTPKTAFEKVLKLEQERHVIDVVARNLLGAKTVQRFVLHIDRSAPSLSLSKFNQEVIEGWLYDESGVKTFTINGKSINIQENEKVFFSFPTHNQNLLLSAEDRLGNRMEVEIPSDLLSYGVSDLHVEFNQSISDIEPLTFTTSVKNDRPVVKINKRLYRGESFVEYLPVIGMIKSEYKIADLTINGKRICHEKAPVIFFNEVVRLEKGDNPIVIQATDEYQQIGQETIRIVRKIPEIYQMKNRYGARIGLFQIKTSTGATTFFQNAFIEDLIQSQRFRIQIDDRIGIRSDPIEFQLLKNEKKPESTIFTTIYNTRHGIEVVARMMDSVTSEIIDIFDVYDEDKDNASLTKLSERLTEKFLNAFPIIEGRVAKSTGDEWVVDSNDHQVRFGWPMVLYRPIDADRFLGSDTQIIAEAKAVRLLENQFGINLLNSGNLKIQKGDLIITK